MTSPGLFIFRAKWPEVGRLGAALIERGVLVDDDPREPWFLSWSHDRAVIGETLQIVEDAVRAVFGVQHAPARVAA